MVAVSHAGATVLVGGLLSAVREWFGLEFHGVGASSGLEFLVSFANQEFFLVIGFDFFWRILGKSMGTHRAPYENGVEKTVKYRKFTQKERAECK